MSNPVKRGRYDALAAATAQFYNTTGTVPSNLKLPTDISYLISSQPSCTIVVADLPPGCSEHDLMALFNRYGQVKNVKLVCNGEAALVEYFEISSPTRLVHMAKINPFCVGPNRVRLEFSSETVPPSSSNSSKREPQRSVNSIAEPSRVLHLDVASADYPITVDVIKAIAQPHGKLLRIFIGKKNVDRSLEALVEFESVDEAKKAKEHLDGADIYSGCCSLTVSFSKLQKVHVTKNDTESWDFTGATANLEGPLGSVPGQRTLLGPVAPPVVVQPALPVPNPVLAPPVPPPAPVPAYAPAVPIPPMMPYPMQQPSPYCQMPSYAPPPPMYPIPPGHPYSTPAQYPAYYATTTATTPSLPVVRSTTQNYTQKPTQVSILPTPPPVHQVTPGGIGVGHATSNLNASSVTARQSDLSLFESVEGVVLMACNLPPTLNCDHLFNLICLYGNVARIKFLKTRRGCAMIQVGNAETADFIHRYYNGVSIFGHVIQFYHSKQRELTEHENLGTLDDGSPVMKNYMMDPNNRFRNAVVAAKSRILEPSRTLHFFNAPLNFSPEDICRVFSESGSSCPPRVVLFNAKPGQKTSLGLAEWDTLSEALEALILANQRPIHIAGIIHPFHLKLAFSPKPISSDRVGNSLIRYPAPPFAATRPGTNGLTNTINAAPYLPEDEDEDERECSKNSAPNGTDKSSLSDTRANFARDCDTGVHRSPHTPDEPAPASEYAGNCDNNAR